MLYPDKLIKLEDGLSLYVPEPELVKPTYENLLLKDAATPFPFWAKIWPSAKAMSFFLKQEPGWVEGKRVLELGAGIGLPSFTIAKYPCELIISDYSTDAVALIEKNIHHLRLQHAKAMRLDWNSFPDNIGADTILLSDINYDPDQFGSLQELIRRFLQQGSNVVLATPQRITATPFVEELQPFIKRTLLQTVKDFDQMVEIGIIILSM